MSVRNEMELITRVERSEHAEVRKVLRKSSGVEVGGVAEDVEGMNVLGRPEGLALRLVAR